MDAPTSPLVPSVGSRNATGGRSTRMMMRPPAKHQRASPLPHERRHGRIKPIVEGGLNGLDEDRLAKCRWRSDPRLRKNPSWASGEKAFARSLATFDLDRVRRRREPSPSTRDWEKSRCNYPRLSRGELHLGQTRSCQFSSLCSRSRVPSRRELPFAKTRNRNDSQDDKKSAFGGFTHSDRGMQRRSGGPPPLI